MLARIFPERIDNSYRGHKLGLWLFYPITLLTVSRSLTHIFESDGGAQSLSKIPLDAFGPGGAETVIGLFARWGVSQLMIGLLFVLVAFRYRAMIPLMYVLILTEFFIGKGVREMKPIVTTGTSSVSLPFLILTIAAAIGFALSILWKPGQRPAE